MRGTPGNDFNKSTRPMTITANKLYRVFFGRWRSVLQKLDISMHSRHNCWKRNFLSYLSKRMNEHDIPRINDTYEYNWLQIISPRELVGIIPIESANFLHEVNFFSRSVVDQLLIIFLILTSSCTVGSRIHFQLASYENQTKQSKVIHLIKLPEINKMICSPW